jgi:phage/plasmid primase-like uncharacterized protein
MSGKVVNFFDFRDAPPQQADTAGARSFTDPVGEFQDALEAAGYGRPDIRAGGIERFSVPGDKPGSKNGWFIFYPDGIPAGAFGSWKTGDSQEWCARAVHDISPAEREANRRRMVEAMARRDEELAKSRVLAAERAAFLWERAKPAHAHAYLSTKGVAAHGLKVDEHGNLVVPLMDRTGKIHSLQFIKPDGAKLFLTGGAKKGNAFWIPGDPAKAVYIAEGYATAASVHAATGATVFVAFDAGNLGPVAQEVRATMPTARIIIAADNDAWTDGNPGLSAAQEAAKAVGSSVVMPSFKDVATRPTDFNDLHHLEGLDVVTTQITGTSMPGQRPLDVSAWGVDSFTGEVPERRWLVEGVLPMSTAVMLASMGDAGKGMLTLDLALKVAGGDGSMFDFNSGSKGWWGHDVLTQGEAVIITAEDDRDEMHRRMAGMDPKGKRREAARGKLFVVPLPNYGGPMPLVVMGKHGPEASESWWRLRDELAKFKNLKLVNLDPLASFIMADLNADPMVGAFTTGLFASLASESGAVVMLAHHMRKAGGKDGKQTLSPAAMRDAVRGTTALVDGVRCLIGLAVEESSKARKVCKKLGEEWAPNKVFRGAVCKSNGPADRGMPTFVRNSNGLLVCRDAELQGFASENDLLGTLQADIAKAARDGRPFTKSGKNGVHERIEELSNELQDISRDRVRKLVDQLLTDKAIVKPNYKGRICAFLDVPDGPFSMGIGEFAMGYAE